MCPQWELNAEREQSRSPVQARRRLANRALHKAERQGGLTLLVDGFAGMGKTFLLRELVEAALADANWQVAVIRADEIEAGEPYSFIERFVASGLIPDWYFMPDARTNPVAVARECVQRLVGEGHAARRVIIIDDAQWIDADSQRVLRYLIPRVTRRDTLLAFGVRTPHDPGSFGEFLEELVTENPLDSRYHLHPLSTQEVASLVVERLGVGISGHTAKRIIDETGGSFLEVDSIISALTPTQVAQLHLSWEVPSRAIDPDNDPLLHQFRGLTATSRATCEIVCLAGHELLQEHLVEAAALLNEKVSLDEAVKAGVLTKSEFSSAIMPRHALLAQAISETIAPKRTSQILRALADVTVGYRSLRYQLLSADKWTDELHGEVSTYALQAADEGRFGTVVEVLRAALDLAEEPDVRTELLESLALVHLRANNSYLMLDLIDEVERLPPSLLHKFMFTVLTAHRIPEHLPDDVVQRLLGAEAQNADERTILAFSSFLIVILAMRSPDLSMVPALIAHAKNRVQQAPADASELDDPRLGWMIAQEEYLVVLDCYRMVQDQMRGDMQLVSDAMPGLIQRIHALDDGPLKVDALVAVSGALLAIGQAGQGRTLAEEGVHLLERVTEPWAASTARLILAHAMTLHGDYSDTIELMELAEEVTYSSLDVETRSGWAALRVMIAAITGQDHPAAYLEQARRQREIQWEGYSPDLVVIAECELARVRGDAAAVLKITDDPWVKQLANTRRGFLTYRAHALIDVGRLQEAGELIEQLTEWRGTRWQEYWGSLDWLRARLSRAYGDDESAEWHFEAASLHREFPLPHGLTLGDYGEFLLDLGRSDDGARTLEVAHQILSDSGAHGYLPRIQSAIDRTSAVEVVPGHEQLLQMLTERERQIVEHLVKGRSNSQIAESLVVSVTTVRSHVSNVLRKLRLSSRGEVARLLRGQEWSMSGLASDYARRSSPDKIS